MTYILSDYCKLLEIKIIDYLFRIQNNYYILIQILLYNSCTNEVRICFQTKCKHKNSNIKKKNLTPVDIDKCSIPKIL